MPSLTPAWSRASSARVASSEVAAIGLSHETCLPGRAAAITYGPCRAFGVAMKTTLTPGSRNIAS